MEAVPIWVQLPDVKLHYYTSMRLNKFASVLGKPLYTDKQTATQDRVAYAHICVEMKVSKPMPTKIHILMRMERLNSRR